VTSCFLIDFLFQQTWLSLMHRVQKNIAHDKKTIISTRHGNSNEQNLIEKKRISATKKRKCKEQSQLSVERFRKKNKQTFPSHQPYVTSGSKIRAVNRVLKSMRDAFPLSPRKRELVSCEVLQLLSQPSKQKPRQNPQQSILSSPLKNLRTVPWNLLVLQQCSVKLQK
jgi:hypothetical protein